MLSLSMALALEPQCLLIDEPSAGLAPIVLSDIRHVLTSLRASGLSLIIVEQRADVVRGLCDRIAVVASGRITHLGTDAGEVSNESLAATYFGNDRVI